MNLLAKSCFAPGLISMMSNLIASAGEEDPPDDSTWYREYQNGKGNEIYRVQVDSERYSITEISFCKLAEVSYSEFQAIVFALEIQSKSNLDKSVIRLNPASFVFNKADHNLFNFHLYIICSDQEIADQVAELEMPEEKFERCFDIKLKNKQTDDMVTPQEKQQPNLSKIEAEKVELGFEGSMKSYKGSSNDAAIKLDSKNLGPAEKNKIHNIFMEDEDDR